MYHESNHVSQLTIVNVYILPHFDFCYVIWGNCAHNLEEKLVKLQISTARVILDCGFYTPSCMMFSELKSVAISRTCFISESLHMFKTIRRNAPEFLRTSFTFATDIHAILLRSSSSFHLYTPKPHLEIYRNTFVFIRLEFSSFIYPKLKLNSAF